jgi:hypothetical protein
MQMRDMAKQSNAEASQEMQMQTLGWGLIKNEIEIEMGLDDKTSGNIAKAVGSDDHPPFQRSRRRLCSHAVHQQRAGAGAAVREYAGRWVN